MITSEHEIYVFHNRITVKFSCGKLDLLKKESTSVHSLLGLTRGALYI